MFQKSRSRGLEARQRRQLFARSCCSAPCPTTRRSPSAVNGAFFRGLADRYDFIPLIANRTVGNTRQSKLNVVNAAYFLRQWAQWTGRLARRRPSIAHYAISAGWAMEKGFVLMNTARLFGAGTVGQIHSGCFLDFWNALPAWRRRRARRSFTNWTRWSC